MSQYSCQPETQSQSVTPEYRNYNGARDKDYAPQPCVIQTDRQGDDVARPQVRGDLNTTVEMLRREAATRRGAATSTTTDGRDVFVFVDAARPAETVAPAAATSPAPAAPVNSGAQIIPLVPVRQCGPKNEHCVWAWIFLIILIAVFAVILFNHFRKKK